MTDNGIRTGVDDFVATVRLNAHSLFEKLVHGFRPGNNANSDQEQNVADAVQLQILRNMTPEQRSILAGQFSDEIREVMLAGIRSRHPGISERQVVVEFARLTLTREEFELAYGNTGIDS